MIFGRLFKRPDDQPLRALYSQRIQSKPVRPQTDDVNKYNTHLPKCQAHNTFPINHIIYTI